MSLNEDFYDPNLVEREFLDDAEIHQFFPEDNVTQTSDIIAKRVVKTKIWNTPDAVLLLQRCVEYCKSSNKTYFDAYDADIDWDWLIGDLKMSKIPKTKDMCIKKVKDIQHQWVCKCLHRITTSDFLD